MALFGVDTMRLDMRHSFWIFFNAQGIPLSRQFYNSYVINIKHIIDHEMHQRVNTKLRL